MNTMDRARAQVQRVFEDYGPDGEVLRDQLADLLRDDREYRRGVEDALLVLRDFDAGELTEDEYNLGGVIEEALNRVRALIHSADTEA